MEINEGKVSRRKVIGGIAAGMAAAVTPSAMASQGQVDSQPSPQTIKQDPVKQYIHPPFPKQEQPWPGLASKMIPVPDHGEKSYKGSGRLNGRKALITGGDSGIGRAAAIAIAREGADIALNYFPTEEPDAQEVYQLLKGEGRKVVLIPGDIREESFCTLLIDKAVAELGGLDILVNVAGRQHQVQSIQNITTELFDWTLKTNAYALFWITKEALKHMQPGAVIINTASEQAVDPSANLVDYAATKAFTANFTKSMAKQLVKQGIRVNAVAPGPVWTPLQVSGGATQDDLVTFGSQTPYQRPGQPAEYGPIYVLLASQESSYTSGDIFGAQGARGVV